jgi:hypothetical protein
MIITWTAASSATSASAMSSGTILGRRQPFELSVDAFNDGSAG